MWCTYIHVYVKDENTRDSAESESESDMEPIIERGLDDDDGSVKVKYADETEQAEDTRELPDDDTEGAPFDDTATDEYERSLDELDTAAEPSLDVEDRAIGVLTVVWARVIIRHFSIFNKEKNQQTNPISLFYVINC